MPKFNRSVLPLNASLNESELCREHEWAMQGSCPGNRYYSCTCSDLPRSSKCSESLEDFLGLMYHLGDTNNRFNPAKDDL
jgi:hypothetical protein